MPMHDWTKAEPGTFHSFHHRWISAIGDALNFGTLPAGFYAMSEKFMGEGEADVLTLSTSEARTFDDLEEEAGGLALLTTQPRTKILDIAEENDEELEAWNANRIMVRYHNKPVIASIEIVSPGHKSSEKAFERFIDKSVELISSGVHLLVIDPFPPSKRDPQGIHRAIWDRFNLKTGHKPSARKNCSLVSYDAAPIKCAFVEPFGIGDSLKEMPLFILPGKYVNVPLEATYVDAWKKFPAPLQAEVA